MIGYITIGSNDLTASADFYDRLLAALDASRAYSLDNMVAYGFGPDRPMLLVTRPHNEEAASHGNGSMVALKARDAAHVDALHALALELGGTDEGAPGPRGGRFYGAYFRDRDDNKLCVFVTT